MNCHKPTLVVYIKGSTTEEVDEFDYLYDILNNKANNESIETNDSKRLRQNYWSMHILQRSMYGTE